LAILKYILFCARCTFNGGGGAGFVDMMIVNVLCDLLFGQNQPLKLAGDQYIGIWENKVKLNKFLIILKRTEDYIV
jgi:hypothetical protein